MKLKKFPVYVNGKEYKITLLRQFEDACFCYYWKARFYLPGKLRKCYVCYVGDNETRPTDYVEIAQEAVKRFEEHICYEEECRYKLKEFEEWDGK